MNSKASLSCAARWLVILMTACMLVGLGAVPATLAPGKQTCTACVRCTCCVKQAPARPSAPLAPASTPQPVVQKDFSLLLTLSVLPVPFGLASDLSNLPLPLVVLPAAAPLYQRHCTYLL